MLPEGVDPVFVIPSGNFGNLTAGLFAKRLGLRVKKFLAATNRNAVVPEYLASGQYQARPSVATISNAMDVGAPSNFVRMLALLGVEPLDVGAQLRIRDLLLEVPHAANEEALAHREDEVQRVAHV